MSTPSSEAALVAVDPGREKAGLAVVCYNGSCLHRQIVPVADVVNLLPGIAERFGVSLVVVGDRTGASLASAISARCQGLEVALVDEHRSTEEGRTLYLDTVPTRGLARLLPRGLRVPKGPVDDFAAWVLGRRYVRGLCGECRPRTAND